MRYIRLDLALISDHKAVVLDEQGRTLTPVLSLGTSAAALKQLLAQARKGAPPQEPWVVGREPTGMAGFPLAVYGQRPSLKVYLVNRQPVADLRRHDRKHAKSDRIDARVLAKLPIVSPEKLHPLRLISATQSACQRGCKELDRLIGIATAIQNRLRTIDRFAWPGLEQILPDAVPPRTRWFREHGYDPHQVLAVGAQGRERAWLETGPNSRKSSPDGLGDGARAARGSGARSVGSGFTLSGLHLSASGTDAGASPAGDGGSRTP